MLAANLLHGLETKNREFLVVASQPTYDGLAIRIENEPVVLFLTSAVAAIDCDGILSQGGYSGVASCGERFRLVNDLPTLAFPHLKLFNVAWVKNTTKHIDVPPHPD